VRKADNLPPSCAVVTKSGSLNFLEPSGPVQACNGTALPLPVVGTASLQEHPLYPLFNCMLTLVKDKGKVVSVYAMKVYSGRRGQLHAFLSSSETKECRTNFFKQILWNMNDEVAYTKYYGVLMKL